jgi:hypothetical protein
VTADGIDHPDIKLIVEWHEAVLAQARALRQATSTLTRQARLIRGESRLSRVDIEAARLKLIDRKINRGWRTSVHVPDHDQTPEW